MNNPSAKSFRQHHLSMLVFSVLSLVTWIALFLKFYVKSRSFPMWNAPSFIFAAFFLGVGIASLTQAMRSLAALPNGQADEARLLTDRQAIGWLLACWGVIATTYVSLTLVYGLFGDDRP